MQDQQHTRRNIPVSVIAGISAVVLAAGGGTAWWTWNTIQTNSPSETSITTSPVPSQVEPSPSEPVAPANETTPQMYWLDVSGNQFELIPSNVELEQASNPDQALTTAFEALLQGPDSNATFSEIPAGTELLALSVEPDGVHVDLSDAFTVGGGTASMTGRLAQVVYTATSLDPDTTVWLSVDGQPLDVLGGEGLIIDQPMTRDGFDENFSL